MKTYTNLQVVYFADDVSVTIIPYERNGDEILFITGHFSDYGIIGTPAKSDHGETSNTGYNIHILLYALLGITSLLIVFFIIKKCKHKIITKK